jgi:hypothetical protein
MDKSIFGLIGYTVLTNGTKYILIMADKHDQLPPCNYDYYNIAEWLKTKSIKSDILLEEVERNEHELGELWESSHTQDLKNLYLNNTKIIIPIDIRNDYIPYSIEVFDKNDLDHNILLYQYIIYVNNFFCMKDPKLIKKFRYYNALYLANTHLGSYFLLLKDNYAKFVEKYNDYLYEKMEIIINNNIDIINEFSDILHSLLEWYAIARIVYSSKKSIICHTGLFHSERIVKYLKELFNYNIIDQQGTNTITQLNTSVTSCFRLPHNINKQFGGYIYKKYNLDNLYQQ